MLNENFKKLLYFGGNGSFKNVAGNSVTLANSLSPVYVSRIVNNHSNYGVGRSFNYSATTAANGSVNEKTGYGWVNVAAASDNYISNGFVLFVGSGNTPPTKDDYCLENALSLNVTSSSCATNADGKTIVTRTFYNNSEESIIIKEIGLYLFQSSNGSAAYVIMLGRKVPTNPVTIPAGESYTFTYIVDMSKITFDDTDL